MADERDDRFAKLLRMVAPGTGLREGLENILRARTGGLVVVGDTPEVMALVDGGFRIDSEFQPSHIYELAKMDGAIVLSSDLKRILYANAQLVPDPAIPSFETGIRHRTAERVARQTGELVIAISQRRNMVSLYKGTLRYVLRETATILTKANQALQTLERYKAVLDQALTNLSALEMEDLATAMDVSVVVQRTEMVRRIEAEVKRYIAELGSEGRLVSMQLEELVSNVALEGYLVLRDYLSDGSTATADAIVADLTAWTPDELLDLGSVGRLLGLAQGQAGLDQPVAPRGFRLLKKIPRVPMSVIENMVAEFGSLQRTVRATIEELDEVEGIGEVRAKNIKEGLKRLREQVMLERHV